MGIYDRSYMRGSSPFARPDGMGMVWKLIIANIIVYFLALVAPGLGESLLLTGGAMRELEVYRLLTAAFLHFDFWHIFLNMWGLYLFGTLCAPYLGARHTLFLYIAGGVTGNLLFLAFNWNTPFALLGASGAVYAVTLAGAMMEPDRRFVIIFMPFRPIKTSTMVIVFTVIEVLSMLGQHDSVAHLAHLGGFIGGYLYLKFARIPLNWDPLKKLFRSGSANSARSYDASEYHFTGGASAVPGRPVPQREVDRLLDKISNSGINSLTEEELATLRRVREEMQHPGR